MNLINCITRDCDSNKRFGYRMFSLHFHLYLISYIPQQKGRGSFPPFELVFTPIDRGVRVLLTVAASLVARSGALFAGVLLAV